MQALLETLPLPVIIRDAERRVTMVNAAWEQMIGVSREEVVGKTFASRTKPPAHARVIARPTTRSSPRASRCATKPR